MRRGFTLAELLIALAILGVIATFTIPKVLQSQTDRTWVSITKEAAGSVSQAYQLYKAGNTVTAATKFSDLTPYLNYVTVDTVSTIDNYPGTGVAAEDCTLGSRKCFRLHNGAILLYYTGANFNGTASTNALYFILDPDGKLTDSTTNGPGKSVFMWLYTDGKVRTIGTIEPGTTAYSGTWGPTASYEPSWFSWN